MSVVPEHPSQPSTLGDAEMLGQLFSRHEDVAYRVALRILGEPADAHDAVQDAFLRTVRVARGGGAPPREPDRLESWLLRVVTNTALGQLRRRSTAWGLPEEQLVEGIPAPVQVEPAWIVEAQETRQEIFEALLALPDQQLAVLALREYQGLSYGEIAATLELTQAAVKMLLFRAREGFKTVYRRSHADDKPACNARVHLLAALAEHGSTAAWRSYGAHRRRCRSCIKAGVGRRRRLSQLHALLALLAAPGAWCSTSTAVQAAALSAAPAVASGGLAGAASGVSGAAVGAVVAASLTIAVVATPLAEELLPPFQQAVSLELALSHTRRLAEQLPAALPSSLVDELVPIEHLPELAVPAPVASALRDLLDDPRLLHAASRDQSRRVEPDVIQTDQSQHQPAASAVKRPVAPNSASPDSPASRSTSGSDGSQTLETPAEHPVSAKDHKPRAGKPVVLTAPEPGPVDNGTPPGQADKSEPPGQVEQDEEASQVGPTAGQVDESEPRGMADQPPGLANQPPKQADEPPGQASESEPSGQAQAPHGQGEQPPGLAGQPPGQTNEPPGQANQAPVQEEQSAPPVEPSKSPSASQARQPATQENASQPNDQADQASAKPAQESRTTSRPVVEPESTQSTRAQRQSSSSSGSSNTSASASKSGASSKAAPSGKASSSGKKS